MIAQRRRLLTVSIAAWAVQGASLRAAPVAVPAWPGTSWSRIPPEEAGWSTAGLAQARDYSGTLETASLLVVHQGRIVDSWGDIERKHELHSVRKSLLSALIGIAVSEGQISLDATLASLGIDDVPPSLTDAEKQATVRQLLQARSGVYHPALYETNGEQRLRPARGSHAPGSFWYYNNWDFNALGTIYERAVGRTIFESLEARIAQPLSMQDYVVSDGRYVRGPESMHAAYPLRMSARDLARFGLLYLHGGAWREQSIVPADWVRESTTGWSQTHIGSGYGYLWWTGMADRGVEIMGLPPRGFWADGHNGQFVIVDTSNDLVVVHQTERGKVSERQMGQLMRMILAAAPRQGSTG